MRQTWRTCSSFARRLAPRSSIFRLIVGEGLRLSAAGIVVGVIVAIAVTGVLRSMLVSVTPTDPATFGGITLLFIAIAALASWLPARAASLDPTAALRVDG